MFNYLSSLFPDHSASTVEKGHPKGFDKGPRVVTDYYGINVLVRQIVQERKECELRPIFVPVHDCGGVGPDLQYHIDLG